MTRTHTIGAVIAIVLALLTTEVLAQQRTIYGSDGKVIGRATTNSNGSTTYYGADGRVSGRAFTSGNTTTFYGPDGRKAGSVTTTKPQGSK